MRTEQKGEKGMLLEFEHVTGTAKRFRLEDVSFALPAGYIMGLAGKNGAGKTTLISYIIEPKQHYTGVIRIDGVDIRENHAAMRNKIGLVSDDNSFLEERTAEQNAELLGDLYADWDGELFQEAMKKLEVPTGRTVGKMSRGERLKFQLAFAMAHHAKLYLLDEVTAGMDPVFRIKFFRMLNELIAQEDVSVLMTSHVPEEIERKMDYVGILKEGRLESFGISQDVMRGENVQTESVGEERNEQTCAAQETREEATTSAMQEETAEAEEICLKKSGTASSTHRMSIADFYHEFLSWRTESIGVWIGCGFLELMYIICMLAMAEEGWNTVMSAMGCFTGTMGAFLYLQPYLAYTEKGTSKNIYEKIRYFPVEWKEVFAFLRRKLLRFLLCITVPVSVVHMLLAQFTCGGICLGNVLMLIFTGIILPYGIGTLVVVTSKNNSKNQK